VEKENQGRGNNRLTQIRLEKMAVKNGVYTALHLGVCLVWSAAPRCWHHIKTPSPVVDLLDWSSLCRDL